MVRVALAEAGGLGMTILRAIVDNKKHDVVLLSRGPKPDLSAKGIDVRAVDYNNHEFIVNVLRGVHTVISTIAVRNNN